jgi:hypothetical protein
MLTIEVPSQELFDRESKEWIPVPAMTIELEHSLASISKWEAEWEVPFLSDDDMDDTQTVSYIRHMTLTPNVPPEIFAVLTTEHLREIQEYMSAKQSATTFNEPSQGKGGSGPRTFVSSELIYYQMVALQIPFECQYWHIKRLLTLIRVCTIKSQESDPSTRKSAPDDMAARRAENLRRRQQYGTSG